MDPLELLQSPSVVLFATLLRDLGFLVYGGGICTFALLTALSARLGGLPTAQVLRTFQGFGPGLGVGMGATVFGALLAHYGTVGAFEWGTDPATGGWAGLTAWLAFLGLWISNIQLEVWTLDPIRKLDPNGTGVASDAAALDRATGRAVRHLGVQATLVAAIVVLTHFT